ncbi:MAG: aminotransferase class V-fold PLP-dependent enzyme, partial [Clostridia bacterium]|nr:aminotransferase class V-fold PLP-dependent enzyme [Clostridia bacterium]
PDCCVLTSGATFSLNLLLQGLLREGGHVVVSQMEHNSVLRPLSLLQNVEISRIPCSEDGSLNPGELAPLLRPNTRAVCVTHASNVCGTLLPVAQIGQICRREGVPFVVDASQTAGHVPIDMNAMNIDGLAIPGHKGLLGPQGIGAALMTRALARALPPLVAGGTGSHSSSEIQPEELPDKFESGTQNLPGVYGLLSAIRFVGPRMEALHTREMGLCSRLLDGLCALAGVRLLGTRDLSRRVAVVAADFPALDNASVADRLARDYGIFTRCGLHCAPGAHQALGSYPQGTVRFSIGWKNNEEEIDRCVAAVREITAKP